MTTPYRRIPAELLADARTTLGEGPVWDAARSRVLWVDIVLGHVNATLLDGTTETIVRVPPPLGAVALRASGGLVLMSGDGIQGCADDGSELTEIIHVPMRAMERWNDAKVDPAGRLIAGTLTERYLEDGTKTWPHMASRLFRVDGTASLSHVLDVTLSNGLGWTPDGRTFFYVDTRTSNVDAFDCQPETGELSGRRTFVSVAPEDGWPDGLAVDAEGGVWLALWGGSAVH